MRLWQKRYKVDKQVLDFCTGNDYVLDQDLIKYDVRAGIAHADMLRKIGTLNGREYMELKKSLREIEKLDAQGKFRIKKEEEDVHTAIENYLTKKLGKTGKKIHTARSRNDQVLAALRLYTKDKLIEIKNEVLDLSSALLTFAEKNQHILFPGYTHTRKAMLSSFGLWAASFVEAFLDDLLLLKTAYDLNNQSPLGGGVGYGVTLKVDREYVGKLAGFGKVQHNTLYVQNSRGKFESIILSVLNAIMFDLNKIATDIIFFSTDDLNYFSLPDKFCTGSSIMPHKKNPDVLELVRAKYHVVLSYEFQMKNLVSNLPSGYNRDLQLTKEPFMSGFMTTVSSLKIMSRIVNELKVNINQCKKAITPEMFATEEALNLVKDGVPFRDAYKRIANNIDKLSKAEVKEDLIKKYIRTVNKLNLSTLSSRITKYRKL
jgi:argininosuccinate lyase